MVCTVYVLVCILMYYMGPKGYVLAGIVSIGYVSVCIGFGFLCSAWGCVCKGTTRHSTVGWLWLLYDRHLLEKKRAVVGQLPPCRRCRCHPKQRLEFGKCLMPKPCLDCASVQLLGTPASDISWWYWHQSAQHARQDGYVLSWGWTWQRS